MQFNEVESFQKNNVIVIIHMNSEFIDKKKTTIGSCEHAVMIIYSFPVNLVLNYMKEL